MSFLLDFYIVIFIYCLLDRRKKNKSESNAFILAYIHFVLLNRLSRELIVLI